jgi:hypothetical protein
MKSHIKELIYKKWNSVDTKTTRIIAHKSSSGVNFGNSSKSDIFSAMAENHCMFNVDAEKFVFLMNDADKQIIKLKQDYNAKIERMIDGSIRKFKIAKEVKIRICDECHQTNADCDCHEDDGTPIRHS